MKIAILQTVTPEISCYTKYTLGINAQYCVEKGYEYHIVQSQLGEERHPSWNRVQALLHFVNAGYDWIMIVDADAIVQNNTITVESIVEQSEDARILICDDTPNGGMINCGVMIVKGQDTVANSILHTWWALGDEDSPLQEYRWKFPYEQHVFRKMLNDADIMKSHLLHDKLVKIFPINTFNSHWLYIPKENFIAHIMARSNEERVEVLKEIYNRIF